MTNANEYDTDDELDDTGDGQRNEPDWLKNLRKSNRELNKELKVLREENASLKTTTRKSTVESLLQARGVNPKIAKYVPADLDASDEAISKWLEEDGDVFNVAAAKTDEAPEEAPGSDAEVDSGGLSPDAQSFFQRLQGAEAGAATADPVADQAKASLNEVSGNAKSADDFFAQLNKAS